MAKSFASWISCRRVDGVTVHLFLRNCTARAGRHLTSTGRWASGSVVMRFMACRNHKWARVPLTSLWLPAMTTCLSVVFCYYKVTTRGSERNAFYHRHVLELSFPLRGPHLYGTAGMLKSPQKGKFLHSAYDDRASKPRRQGMACLFTQPLHRWTLSPRRFSGTDRLLSWEDPNTVPCHPAFQGKMQRGLRGGTGMTCVR